MTAPERSLAQRMDALERANDVRVRRAAWKRRMKTGHESVHAMLLDPPAWMDTAKVFDVLLATPKYGRVKVNKALTQCRISPSKTMGGLSQRQRDELVSLLRRPVVASGTPEYQASRRLSTAYAVHYAPKGEAICNTAYASKMTRDATEVSCLSCVGVMRADVRDRIRGGKRPGARSEPAVFEAGGQGAVTGWLAGNVIG